MRNKNNIHLLKSLSTYALSCLVFCFSAACFSVTPLGEGAVTLDSGSVIGLQQNDYDQEVINYRGIPYAAPPVDELRWAKPQSVNPFGLLEAFEFQSECAQIEQDALLGSEDCLYLNVWAPANLSDSEKPVMVWIHGGGNQTGAISTKVFGNAKRYLFDGQQLAAKHDVIVVTLNYRLGPLGFFPLPGVGIAGNQGLLDQRFALEWVKTNISAFGGNPNNVTLFGESAGAFNTCYHVAAGAEDGLFHRAISQSGACIYKLHTADSEYVQDLFNEYATGASCTEGAGQGDSEAVLACLREESGLLSMLKRGANRFTPIVDGEYIKDQPEKLFETGQAAQVPYLLGSNQNEGLFFQALLPNPKTEQEYLNVLIDQLGASAAPAVAATYPLDSYASGNKALATIYGDYSFVCNVESVAKLASLNNNTYLYNFAFPVATHASEIIYIFGVDKNTVFKRRQDISNIMQGYWAGFARHGHLGGVGPIDWPAYNAAENTRLEIISPKPYWWRPALHRYTNLVQDHNKAQCDFWASIRDELPVLSGGL